MDKVNGDDELLEDESCHVLVEGPALPHEVCLEVGTVDVLHDDTEVPWREEDLVELDNVGVFAEGESLMMKNLPQHVFVE